MDTVEQALTCLQKTFPDFGDEALPELGDGGGVPTGRLARGYSKTVVKALLQEFFQQA